MSARALAGIRVLDLTGLHGAYGTKLLAELGAEVIRVEHPSGDSLRRHPPFIQDDRGVWWSLYDLYVNAAKRSITLDLTTPDGRCLFRRLSERVDAIVESDPPGAVRLAGLAYDELARSNPRLVYTRVTPFGDEGPKRHWKACDLTLMAAGGLMWLAGEPGGPPIAAAGEQSAVIAGLYAAVGTLLAVYHAEATGEGQLVSVSVQECICSTLENAVQFYDLEGRIRRRVGSRPVEAGTGLYPCRDGYIYVHAGRLATARGWRALVAWLVEAGVPGADELTQPHWQDYSYRASREGAAAFWEIFTRFTRHHSKRVLCEEAQRRGIAMTPVNVPTEVVNDPQLAARQWFVSLHHEGLGIDLRLPGAPYRLSETPWQTGPAPLPGQHNREVFCGELGLTIEELEALRQAGVV